MRRTVPGLALDLAAAALVALYLAVAMPGSLWHSFDMLSAAATCSGESLADARARSFGSAYVRAIDEIRAAVPADQAYLLVADEDAGLADTYWVRYDLAPRRAFLLGLLNEWTDAQSLRRRIAVNVRRVVVAHGNGQPPRLYARYEFLNEIERRSGAAATGADARP
jgi:hypothetical protein